MAEHVTCNDGTIPIDPTDADSNTLLPACCQLCVCVLECYVMCWATCCVQAGVLEALPRVDIETAQDLQRCQQTSDEAHSNPTHCATESVDATSSSVIDITHQSSYPDISRCQDTGRKEHILVRRPRETPSGCSNEASADTSSTPSVWDNYNAEEEALLMQGHPSKAHHPTPVDTANSRQSSRVRATDTHRGPSYIDESALYERGQRSLWHAGSSPVDMYHNGVVPFSKRDSSPDTRAHSTAQDSAGASIPRGAGAAFDSGPHQTQDEGGHPATTQPSNGRHVGGDRHIDGSSFPSPAVLRTRAERSASAVASKPKGRRGAAKDVDLEGLPAGLRAVEHKGHPWIRCSNFALLPIMGQDLCSVRDASGSM